MAAFGKAAVPIVGLGLVAVCFLALVLAGPGRFSGSTRQGEAAVPPTPVPVLQTGLPAIDAAAPARTETATFALG